MDLRIVHIGDLKGMCFNIPDYQRGYRWETKQVCELLDDLLEFDNSKNGAFYCLQPLVVVKNNQKLLSDNEVFDVIDGQQRLTTMFLIINILTGKTPYRLRYDRACDKKKQIDFFNGEITYDKLLLLSDSDIENNPDYFYLSKAREDIEKWFVDKEEKYDGIRRIIDDVIKDKHFKNREKPFYEDTSGKDENENQADVRFIWYDATNADIDYKGSISVFKRLNYGKTPLTAAELIKALLFQCDIYKSVQKAERRQIAFRMSSEWDRMEKALQNPFMRSMLAPEKKDKISNIDCVLSYVTSQLVAKNKLEIKSAPTDDDYDYIVFDRYIKKEYDKRKDKDEYAYATIVDELWQKIQDVFDVFMSWYKERDLYHLIGLRLTLLNPKNKNRSLKERQDYNNTLHEMYVDFTVMDMTEFKNKQRKEIGNLININRYNRNIQEGEEPVSLANLTYGQHDMDLIRILLVYNVTLCIKNSQDNQYFPFWFYQDITPSLEHIHPQHLHDEDISFDIRCQWYSEKCKEIDEIEFPVKLEKGVISKGEIDEARMKLNQVLLLTDEEKNKENKTSLSSYNSKKQKFEANENDYGHELDKIDKLFDELAKIDPKELHSIRNMALVDKDSNAALGNGLMATKRQKLMKRQSLFNKTNGEEGAYTFMGTWKVFNKQFLEINAEEYTTHALNLLFWSKKDRDNYFADIESIYNEYTK